MRTQIKSILARWIGREQPWGPIIYSRNRGVHTNGTPIGCSSHQAILEFLLQVPVHAVQFIFPVHGDKQISFPMILYVDRMRPREMPEATIFLCS